MPGKVWWYVVTAGGKAVKGDRSQKGLAGILAAFEKLPEADRKGLGNVPLDERYKDNPNPVLTELPPGIVPLIHNIRYWMRDGKGSYRPMKQRATTPDQFPHSPVYATVFENNLHWQKEWAKGAAPIRVVSNLFWVTEEELRALAPANPRLGDKTACPVSLTKRFLNFGLEDDQYMTLRHFSNSYTDKLKWKGELSATVEEVSDGALRLRLEGPDVEITYPAFGAAFKGGTFKGRVHGVLVYDRAKEKFTRFDVVMLGDYEGSVGTNYYGFSQSPAFPKVASWELAPREESWTRRTPFDQVLVPKTYGLPKD